MSTVPDRIQKQITLRAPQSRVWSAISNAEQFGTWFGVKFDGPFAAGKRITGKMTPTQVDPEVAAQQKPYEGMAFDFIVDRIEPEHLFSFWWHPFAIDPKVDYAHEEATLVVFELEQIDGGTRLTITESGFDRIPLERRAKAFTANEGGWAIQTRLIEKYLLRHAA